MTKKKDDSTPSSKINKRLILLPLLAGAAGFFLVSGYNDPLQNGANPRAAKTGESAFPFSGSLTGNYLAGRYAAAQGDFSNAERYLGNTLKYDPENRDLAGYNYRVQLITGEMDDAVAIAKKLHALGDEGAKPELMVLLSFVKEQKYGEARELLKTFEAQGFNLVIVPLIEGWLDLAEGKLKEPLKQNETLRRIADFAPFLYYQTALINDLAGFEDEALVQYNESITLSRSVPYRVVEMMANLHARRGEWDKAEALIARYREQNPDAVLPSRILPLDRSKTPARLVNTPREGVAEILFSTASILQGESMLEEALIYAQQVIYLNPEFSAAQLMRAMILEEGGRTQEALEAYDAIPASNPYYQRAQIRKAYVLNTLDQGKEGIALLDRLAKSPDVTYQAGLARGDILMRLKQYDEAAAAYTKALDAMTIRPGHWPIFYARGISYERSGNWELAEKDFRKALELQPAQPDVLNYLAYSWLTRGEKLNEAKAMLEQAVKARPTDGHIIDSMGWAFYTLGDYEKAVVYLEQAIELMPVDPTVNDHLGDAYWQLGRKNEARFQWKRALLFNPEAEQMAMLNRKLAEGLPQVSEKDGMAQEDADGQQRAALRP